MGMSADAAPIGKIQMKSLDSSFFLSPAWRQFSILDKETMSTPRDLFPDLYPNAKPRTTKSLTPSIPNTSVIKSESKHNPLKELWCETQWTVLSLQAKNHGLAKDPYFDPKTMRLSKEVNMKLWKQLVSLYLKLGCREAAISNGLL